MGMGLYNYFGDKFNVFDFIINVISITEIILLYSATCVVRGEFYAHSDERSACSAHRSDNSMLIDATVFRVLRLIRVFRALKIVQKWKSMKHILNAVAASGPGLLNFCCLLLLFSFIYSLCGMQMFAGKFTKGNGFGDRAPGEPRANFDNLANALLTVFIIVSGENWNEVLYDTMKVDPYIGALFVVSMCALKRACSHPHARAVTAELFLTAARIAR